MLLWLRFSKQPNSPFRRWDFGRGRDLILRSGGENEMIVRDFGAVVVVDDHELLAPIDGSHFTEDHVAPSVERQLGQ